MQIKYDKYFIKRYLNGACSQEEKKAFLQWLNHPHTRENDAWMQEIWEEGILQDKDFLGAENRILYKVLAEIKKSEADIDHLALPSSRTISVAPQSIWHRFPVLRYAAVILLLLFPLILLQYFKVDDASSFTTTPVYKKKFTGEAQRLTFMLKDGSKITLNSNSSLEFPEMFSDSLRKVILYGEAFFEVAKDAERPFTVIAGNVSTVALGTSFNIRNDTSENKTTVSLASGKVLVQNRKKDEFNIYLTPGEELDYHAPTKTYTKNQFDYQEKIAWKDGILYFGEDNIDTIVSKLEQWYGVSIELKNRPEEEWYFAGAFKDQSLENVLAGMAYSKDFEFSIEGKKVVLTF